MKKYPGIGKKGNSIEFRFTHQNRFYRPSWDLLYTAANVEAARKHLDNVKRAMLKEKTDGIPFNVAEFFPNNKSTKHKLSSSSATVGKLLYQSHEVASPNNAHTTNRKELASIHEFDKLWGTLDPTDLTTAMLEKWITDCKKPTCEKPGLTIKTIRNKAAPLCRMLDTAARRGIIEFNPWSKLDPEVLEPSREEQERRALAEVIDRFSLDELTAILNTARPSLHNLIMLLVGIGPRPNEAFGLAWEDIDLVRGTLHFRLGRVEKRITSLKTDGSNRIIELARFPRVWEALKRQKQLTFMWAPVNEGKFGERHYVFYNPITERPWMDDEHFRRQWATLLRKAGVRYRFPYQLRHTFAVWCRVAGERDLWIAKTMGTSIEMLNKHYADQWPSKADQMTEAAGSQLQKLWEKRT